MKRNVCLLPIVLLCAVTVFGQSRTQMRSASDVREGTSGSIVGSVVGVDEARRQVQVQPDEGYQQLTVVTDAISTTYLGFGGVINGSPEIYTGSTGFANIRVGDRLEVRGSGRANAILAADSITLLGRSVDASQVGVGTTRPTTSVSTPSSSNPTRSDAVVYANTAEGTIRQVNLNEGRIVIQTNDRRIVNVRATRSTPVYYRNEVYRIDNLEIGDRIRIETDTRSTTADEITARTIDVTQSVQDSSSSTLPTDRRVTTVTGRVTRVDRTSDSIRVNNGRSEIRVDMTRAADAGGRAIHAADLRVNDDVDISGTYSGTTSDLFLASTVRFGNGGGAVFGDDRNPPPATSGTRDYERPDYAVYSLSGTVTETLQTSPVLVVRDRATGRNVEVFVTEDFIYRTKAGSYTTADHLNVGDAVLIKAYRDQDNNLIAQSIRIRQ